jgi:hypothetical protein
LAAAPLAVESIHATLPTAIAALRKLETLGIVRELTGGNYRRTYAYTAYLDLLNEGTEPLND